MAKHVVAILSSISFYLATLSMQGILPLLSVDA